MAQNIILPSPNAVAVQQVAAVANQVFPNLRQQPGVPSPQTAPQQQRAVDQRTVEAAKLETLRRDLKSAPTSLSPYLNIELLQKVWRESQQAGNELIDLYRKAFNGEVAPIYFEPEEIPTKDEKSLERTNASDKDLKAKEEKHEIGVKEQKEREVKVKIGAEIDTLEALNIFVKSDKFESEFSVQFRFIMENLRAFILANRNINATQADIAIAGIDQFEKIFLSNYYQHNRVQLYRDGKKLFEKILLLILNNRSVDLATKFAELTQLFIDLGRGTCEFGVLSRLNVVAQRLEFQTLPARTNQIIIYIARVLALKHIKWLRLLGDEGAVGLLPKAKEILQANFQNVGNEVHLINHFIASALEIGVVVDLMASAAFLPSEEALELYRKDLYKTLSLEYVFTNLADALFAAIEEIKRMYVAERRAAKQRIAEIEKQSKQLEAKEGDEEKKYFAEQLQKFQNESKLAAGEVTLLDLNTPVNIQTLLEQFGLEPHFTEVYELINDEVMFKDAYQKTLATKLASVLVANNIFKLGELHFQQLITNTSLQSLIAFQVHYPLFILKPNIILAFYDTVSQTAITNQDERIRALVKFLVEKYYNKFYQLKFLRASDLIRLLDLLQSLQNKPLEALRQLAELYNDAGIFTTTDTSHSIPHSISMSHFLWAIKSLMEIKQPTLRDKQNIALFRVNAAEAFHTFQKPLSLIYKSFTEALDHYKQPYVNVQTQLAQELATLEKEIKANELKEKQLAETQKNLSEARALQQIEIQMSALRKLKAVNIDARAAIIAKQNAGKKQVANDIAKVFTTYLFDSTEVARALEQEVKIADNEIGFGNDLEIHFQESMLQTLGQLQVFSFTKQILDEMKQLHTNLAIDYELLLDFYKNCHRDTPKARFESLFQYIYTQAGSIQDINTKLMYYELAARFAESIFERPFTIRYLRWITNSYYDSALIAEKSGSSIERITALVSKALDFENAIEPKDKTQGDWTLSFHLHQGMAAIHCRNKDLKAAENNNDLAENDMRHNIVLADLDYDALLKNFVQLRQLCLESKDQVKADKYATKGVALCETAANSKQIASDTDRIRAINYLIKATNFLAAMTNPDEKKRAEHFYKCGQLAGQFENEQNRHHYPRLNYLGKALKFFIEATMQAINKSDDAGRYQKAIAMLEHAAAIKTNDLHQDPIRVYEIVRTRLHNSQSLRNDRSASELMSYCLEKIAATRPHDSKDEKDKNVEKKQSKT